MTKYAYKAYIVTGNPRPFGILGAQMPPDYPDEIVRIQDSDEATYVSNGYSIIGDKQDWRDFLATFNNHQYFIDEADYEEAVQNQKDQESKVLVRKDVGDRLATKITAKMDLIAIQLFNAEMELWVSQGLTQEQINANTIAFHDEIDADLNSLRSIFVTVSQELRDGSIDMAYKYLIEPSLAAAVPEDYMDAYTFAKAEILAERAKLPDYSNVTNIN